MGILSLSCTITAHLSHIVTIHNYIKYKNTVTQLNLPFYGRCTLFDPGWPNITSYRSVWRYFTITVNIVLSSTHQSLCLQRRTGASPVDAFLSSQHQDKCSTGNRIQSLGSPQPKHPSPTLKQQQAGRTRRAQDDLRVRHTTTVSIKTLSIKHVITWSFLKAAC